MEVRIGSKGDIDLVKRVSDRRDGLTAKEKPHRLR